MRTRSAYLLLVVVLLGSSLLESTNLAEAIPYIILDFDYLQNFERFIGKANFVAEQFSFYAIESLDVNITTYFAFYVILSAFVFIKIENQKIKFYNIRRMISFVFVIILVSSSIVAPFSYSVLYWNDVLAQEDTPVDEQMNILQTRNNLTGIFDENLILFDNATVLLYYNEIKTLESNLTTTLIEILNLTENITIRGIPQNYSETFFEQLAMVDHVFVPIDSRTINKTILPNATESWQFENSTDNIELIGDAEIDYIEGINGTSLALDGDNDFAQTNSSNQKKIKEMSISVWVKPNYASGSPEFTIVSKEKSFVLSLNNLIEPQHIAKFSVYDGKSWHTVTGSTPINNWSHVAATFNRENILLYVNGTLDGIFDTDPTVVAASSSDVIIGALMMLNRESNAFNMFSGMIDGVQLFDSKLEPEEVMQLYMDTIPIKAPEPEPESSDTLEPSVRFSILNSTKVDLPVFIPATDLNNDLNQLTVSTWINPNYTGGSAEFTVIGKENSFVLELNKMETPQRVAKFSVYDGQTWYTVKGNTPINSWSHVAATINGEKISLYVNGTLDGRRHTGPTVVDSTSDVVIGAYENNLREEPQMSNFFSGVIQQAEVYKYVMADSEILDMFQQYMEKYQLENDLQGGKNMDIPKEEGSLQEISKTLLNQKFVGIAGDLKYFKQLRKISNVTDMDEIIKVLPLDSEIHKLFEKVAKEDSVKVIIELDAVFQPEGSLDSKNKVLEQRKNIKSAQDSLLKSLSNPDLTSIIKLKYTPFIVASVDKNTLEEIITSQMVKSIQEDIKLTMNLDASVPLIGGDSAHASGFTGTGYTVAVIDTGVDSTHGMLSGKVVEEGCFVFWNEIPGVVDGCPNTLNEQIGAGSAVPCSVFKPTPDDCGHGTHVAGIAAGNGAFDGVAKNSDIIAIQVFQVVHDDPFCGGPGTAPCLGTQFSSIQRGLDYVFSLSGTYNIASVNISIGGGLYASQCDVLYPGIKASMDNLKSVGIATIVSSGNDLTADQISSPACITTAISVGSTDVDSHGYPLNDDEVSPFSNAASILDLLAPGSVIRSAYPGAPWADKSGTSMAAPHVTGAWAVLKQRYPNIPVDDALLLLKNTGKPILDSRPGSGLIFPRIQVFEALNPFSVDPDSAAVNDSIFTTISLISGIKTDSASVEDSISAAVISFISETTTDSASVEDSISAAVISFISETTTDSASVEDSISASISSQPPPSTPTLPDEGTLAITTGHHKTGGGPSSTSIGMPSSPRSGGGNSEPKPENIVEETTNYNPPPVKEEKYEKTEPQPTTEPVPVTKSDDVNKEEEITSPDMTEFIEQIKNIQQIMMISAISLVIAVFLIRARGILFG